MINDEQHGGCLVLVMMLCHEHDDNPEMRPASIDPEQREIIIVHMAAGLVTAYRYFREHRQEMPSPITLEPGRSISKVGETTRVHVVPERSISAAAVA